jgi:ribosomal protein L16 Arg81 hydroxylase
VDYLEPEYSLAWLVRPLGRDEFLRDFWERRPALLRGNPARFKRLLTLDRIDEILTTDTLDYPQVSLTNAAREVSRDEYVNSAGTVDPERLCRLYAAGCTVILSHLHERLDSLATLCRALENEFTFRLQTNVYLTPAGAQGFKPHFDTHDVWILQLTGAKRWKLYDSPLGLPLRGQEYDPLQHAGGAAADYDVQAGDVLYIPRGRVHEAHSAQDGCSVHITLGLLTYTWADLLLEAAAAVALRDEAFRTSLPPGFAWSRAARQSGRQQFAELVHKLAGAASYDEALETFADDFLMSRTPPLRGQILQATEAQSIHPDTRFRARPHVSYRPQRSPEGGLTLNGYGRQISFPARFAPAVEFSLRAADFSARDLPGSLSDTDALGLLRRLIEEGIVVAGMRRDR